MYSKSKEFDQGGCGGPSVEATGHAPITLFLFVLLSSILEDHRGHSYINS